MSRKRSSIAQVRSFMYGTAKFLGDVQAVRNHRIKKRLWNRLIGRESRKVLRGLMK